MQNLLFQAQFVASRTNPSAAAEEALEKEEEIKAKKVEETKKHTPLPKVSMMTVMEFHSVDSENLWIFTSQGPC